MFGDYIDIDDMTQAVEDGATRPVYYENLVIKLKLDETALKLINAEYDIMANNADPEVIQKSKRKLGQMEAVLGNEQTIHSLVDEIAIIVDMWLAGFNVPSMATMYVYKPMQGYNLMQAIARVNRVFRDKEGGIERHHPSKYAVPSHGLR